MIFTFFPTKWLVDSRFMQISIPQYKIYVFRQGAFNIPLPYIDYPFQYLTLSNHQFTNSK